MGVAATGVPSWFTLRVPRSWFEFDVWRATRTGDLARLVDARVAHIPQLRQQRSALLRLLREVAERAERQGAVYCAAAADPVEGSGGLVASVMVFHTDGAPNAVDNTVDAIAGHVTAVAPTDRGFPWRTVTIVEIPAGRAVRVRGVERAEPDGVPIDSVVMQTLVPVPGDRGVLNVVLSSPHVDIADDLFDLFDAISDTLAWSRDRPDQLFTTSSSQ
ncbi:MULTISPECIES: hypothetical protein [Frankiaceae]|uniref:Uncharacterized protein n=1 Tax=Candidatus Protofrankia datiscae TaxID=2716812 RepID=F8AXP9_9ACTN|nr:hypothetical protein FsymDg_3095 [Candidatus Protofrankia datiscae]